MNISDTIRILLIKCGNIPESELAKRLGQSPQNFHRKLKRQHFTFADLQEVAAALNLKIKLSFLFESGEEYTHS